MQSLTKLMEPLLPAARPARLALGAVAAYFIFRAGASAGEVLYYLTH